MGRLKASPVPRNQIISGAMEKLGGKVDLRHEDVCFVPTVSAVAIRDIEKQDDLYANVGDLDPQESELDAFLCSSTTTAHTGITEELRTWIMDRPGPPWRYGRRSPCPYRAAIMGPMTSSPPQRWARAERLDAVRTLDALRAQTGVRLTLDGPCPGGQVGTAYVCWPDDRRSVLKWRPHSRAEDLEAGPLTVSRVLRHAGCPAPATELVAQVGHAVVMVQELLPGTKIDHFDGDLLVQALDLNRSQAGRLADHTGVPAAELFLRQDGPGYCLHEPLRRHNRRSAALEHRVAAIGADHPDRLAGDDAVHMDFHPGNLLAADGSITGVVDWDGAARGDHRFDLVTLRFGIHGGGADPGVTRHLDAVLDAVPEEVLRPAWAHMSLRMVDWAIRHFAPSDVEHWLDLAEQRVN